MKKHLFSGTGIALITPFKNNKEIDYLSLEKIINRAIENGVDYLVTLGTTGETATLSATEKNDIVRFTVQTVAGRTPVVVGIGGNSTGEVVYSLEKFDLQGVDGILSVAPYYNKPNQEGIFRHYKMVGEASPLPVISYNVPGRTGVNMTAETTLRIAADCPNIIAVKEASGNMAQIMQVLKNRPEHFLVISGDDNLTFPMITLGADGVISVTAQAVPKTFSDMVHSALAGDFEKARENHYRMLELTDAFFADGSPAGVKAGLHILGLCENELRLPLVPVNEKVYNTIKSLIEKLRL